mgnify:CR=1 FL=1
MSALLTQLGCQWANSAERPTIGAALLAAWDQLIERWIDSDLPLVIRKSGGIRGAELQHKTGRRLIVADNSPAQWSFTRAFEGAVYQVADIRAQLGQDVNPFAVATKSADKASMKYRCTLSSRDNVNKRGWKLCHIEEVGLSSRMPLESMDISLLVSHFRRLLAPSNQFLVPLAWSGLGEVPEFIEALRSAGSATPVT